MRNGVRTVAMAAVGGWALVACGGAAETASPSGSDETRAVMHALGTTEVVGTPERVVVLDSGELDAAASLGVVPVGAVQTEGLLEDLASTLGFDAADVAEVGTIASPDLEAIAALQPDLILSNVVRHEDLYDQLSGIAPTVMAADVGDSWRENLLLDAEALGRAPEGDTLLEEFDRRAVEVGRLYGDPARVEVSVVRFMGAGAVRAYAEGSFIGTVLEQAGFARPVLVRVPDTFVELSAETLTEADGDLLFYAGYGVEGDAELTALTAGAGLWQQLSAVRSGAAFPVDDDRWFLGIGPTGAGLVLDDLEALAAQR